MYLCLQTVGLWDSLTPSFFTVIDLVMAILLGIRCEVFMREVKETKRLVITVMSIHYDGILLDILSITPPLFIMLVLSLGQALTTLRHILYKITINQIVTPK